MIVYVRDRQRLLLNAAALAVFLFCCFVFGVFSVRNTTQGVILIGFTFCVVVYWTRPQVMAWVAMFLAFASLPQGLPPGKVIGPLTIYGHHVPLLLALCYLLPSVRPRFSTCLLPAVFALTVVFFAVAGIATGHDTAVVLKEAMFLLEMVAGFMLALLIVAGDHLNEAIHAIAVTLWLSAGLAVLSSLHVIQLAGRAESLESTTGAAEAVRVITNTLTPAIAVLATLVVAAIVGRVRPVTFFALGPPALIVSMLAFSRNTLICVSVAAVVAFAASVGWPALRRTAVLAVSGVAILAASVSGALFLLQRSTAGAWLGDQVTGFNQRVLGGVSSSALATDSSTLARLAEDANLNRAIANAPVFGHGLGYAYQLPYGDGSDAFDTFASTLGTTYSHNFYLWWLCKAGGVGMAAFALFALIPVARALRNGSAAAKASAAVSLGLLVMSVIDPLPEEPGGALALGLALGSAMAFGMRR